MYIFSVPSHTSEALVPLALLVTVSLTGSATAKDDFLFIYCHCRSNKMMSYQDTGLPRYPALGGWVTSPSLIVLILKLKHLDTVFSYSSQIPG